MSVLSRTTAIASLILAVAGCSGRTDKTDGGCVPTDCAAAGAQCGLIDDGCGGQRACGGCSGTDVCNAGTCGTCVPQTCANLGFECGTHNDGCGGSVTCGPCTLGATCNTTTFLCDACVPQTCTALGFDCGVHDDGCGTQITCPGCIAPEVCDASEVCCTPRDCSSQGFECGVHQDGCGNTLDCGDCGGPPTVCDAAFTCCSPTDCATLGYGCGLHDDGCNTQIDCGTCTNPGEICDSTTFQCLVGCIPTDCASAGANCGDIPDGCGSTIDCGTCTVAGESCGAGGTANVCAAGTCTPTDCTAEGATCGQLSDGCTSVLDCGSCGLFEQCVSNGCLGDNGAACSGSSGCASANCQLAATSGFPGGHCSEGCSTDADCVNGGHCLVDPVSFAGICVADCTTNADCRSGYACYDPFGTGVSACLPACTSAARCQGVPGAPLCDATLQRCVACLSDGDCTAPDICRSGSCLLAADIGGACDADRDCLSADCFDEFSSGLKDGYCTTQDCSSDADCAAGSHCAFFAGPLSGDCVQTCLTNGDCRGAGSDGYLCYDADGDGARNECWGGGTGTGNVGDACAADWDCAGGRYGWCAVDPTWPSGYCLVQCGAAGATSCPVGSECVAFAPGDPANTSYCLDICTDVTDCRGPGYVCTDSDTSTTPECSPGDGCTTNPDCSDPLLPLCHLVSGVCGECVADADCPAAETCTEGTCFGTVAVGGVCDDANACLDGDCLTEADSDWPGGYCTGQCTTNADCPANTHCGLGGGAGNLGLCVANCTTNSDCRTPNYECYDTDTDGTNECAPAAVGAGAVGDPCTGLVDCGGGQLGRCISESGSEWPAGYCSTECTTDADCSANTHCLNSGGGNGLCVVDCTTNADCRTPNYECYDFDNDLADECAPVGGGPGAVGDACAGVVDCGGGQPGRCLTESGSDWPAGYCTILCTTNADCAAGSHCGLDDGAGNPIACLADCTVASDCRQPNYACYDQDGDSSKECAPTAAGTGAIGEACTSITQCAGGNRGFCAREGTYWPGGYCTVTACTAAAGCPTASHCAFIDGSGEGFCMADCPGGDSDCRAPNYQCYDRDLATAGECAPVGVGSGAVGDSCAGILDCGGGQHAWCLAAWPSGYCVIECTTGTGVTCDVGDYCQPFVGGQDYCLATCASVADCRPTYQCAPAGGPDICRP